jgi:hypothetical protein
VDSGDQLFRRVGRLPRPVGQAAAADFGDDHQPGRVRVQGLPDDPVGNVRAIEVCGVDMIYAGCNSFAEKSDGAIGIFGRPPDTGTGQFHRTVAYPPNRQ